MPSLRLRTRYFILVSLSALLSLASCSEDDGPTAPGSGGGAGGNETTMGDCLSPEEAQLVTLINDYRADNGLEPIPVTKSLTAVAQWHVWDLDEQHPHDATCNLHSWSSEGTWSEVCYTSDHAQAAGMWNKPREITADAYDANGYEIAYWSSGGATAEGALNGWKGSSGHNAVILSEGIWAGRDPWPAMGVGIREGYAVVWFGDVDDPQGAVDACP
jgi:uncharacterized protein YkwD